MTLPVTFTGTAGDTLTTYDADWQRLSGDTGTWVISNNNRARRGTASTASQYTYAGFTPASADYDVEADFTIISTSATERLGIIGRADSASRTFYLLRLTITGGSTTATITLMEANNASPAVLTSTTTTIAVNDVLNLRLSMQGSAIKAFLNDTEILSVTDSTITTAGRIGVYYSSDSSTPSNTVGAHLDNIDVTEAAARVCDLSNTLASSTLSAAATETVVADASKTFDAISISSTSSVSDVASLSVTLNNTTLTAASTVTAVANASITLDSVTLSSTVGQDQRNIDLSKTLDSVSVSSAVTSGVVINTALSVGGVVLSSTVETIDGRELDVNVTLQNVTASGGGTSSVVATVNKTVGSVTMSSSVVVTDTANLSKQLNDTTINAQAGFTPERFAVLSATLGNVTITASIIPKLQPTPVAKRTIRVSDFKR